MLNVDLGYLTFKMAFGNFDMWQLKNGANVSIAAVDSRSKRKDIYPSYKEHRNAKNDENVEMVWELRNRVQKEQVLPLCKIDGLEADDIVACWQLFNPSDHLVGIDKDFFQLPNVENVYYHDLKPYNFLDSLKKLPQYVQPLACKNFALYQMLLGDVADNIPRLLAKGKEGKEQLLYLQNAMSLNKLSVALGDLFKTSIVINAKLVLCPYYEWFDEGSTDWFEMWCLGHYYNRNYWESLYTKIQETKLVNSVPKQLEMFELF